MINVYYCRNAPTVHCLKNYNILYRYTKSVNLPLQWMPERSERHSNKALVCYEV